VAAPALLSLIESTFNAQLFGCGVTSISRPHSVGWRTLPFMVSAEIVDGADLMEFEDRAPITMAEGECLVVTAGIRHRFTLISPRQAVSRWSHAQFTAFGSLDILALVEPPLVLRGAPARRIGEINQRIVEQEREPSLLGAARRRAALFHLLEAILAESVQSSRSLETLREAQRLAPALVLIEEHLEDTELSVEGLARACGLSTSRLHAVFAAATGTSPARFLQRRRMARAEQLLISGDLLIREVAARTGYGDEFHFSRLFKRLHGTSPLAYREQARLSGH
jgi:AraC-like DNA-binding protein